MRKRLRHQTEEPHDYEEALDEETPPSTNKTSVKSVDKHSSKEKRTKKKQKTETSKDPYAHLDPTTAAAMRRDDEEIAALEAKLRLSDKKDKSRLNKEYAKLEGYGDDFGEFLDDLDGMTKRITQGSRAKDNDTSDEESYRGLSADEEEKSPAKKNESKKGNLYDMLDADTAASLRRDDEEIATLEAKLGLSDKKEKKRLHREYATLECYGEDFGEFLNDLDGIVDRVVDGKDCDNRVRSDPKGDSDSEADFDDDDDEIVPMKGPSFDDLDEDDSVMAEIENQNNVEVSAARDSESDSDSDGDSEGSDQEQVEDHNTGLTYRPIRGQDIYGNTIGSPANSTKPQKYVPPHLRKKQDSNGAVDDQQRQQSFLQIQRSLNNPLNRLSEDTLISVSQEIAKLYPLHSTSDVNECIWKSTKNTCVARSHLMTGLIPVFVAALCGVHVINGDSSQLGEYIMEKVVVDLWKEVKVAREKVTAEDTVSDVDLVAKEASNLMLCLCYLYIFGVVHCSLMYDVVRDFIESFKEIDVELLLLILNHCGRALRSDDPSALKDIVLLVQKRALDTKDTVTNVSRVDYMVSAILDLKNNKRRNQSAGFVEKTARLKKILGQIKSSVASSNGGFRSESSTRISLSDLLNAETQGRFWKVGASWVGNQFRFQEEDDGHDSKPDKKSSVGADKETPQPNNEEDAKLLKLATKYRMNTDVRRSVFCIIMGSADCDDAFEKLVRAEMLKNRTEKETVRVLMECCGNEKSFNKYYAHLAARICEFQPQCKFSFQLAFWDAFKTFEQTKARKAANLAKLLFHLVAVNFALRLSVLKAIDMSSPDELSETSMIFLTVFLSSILEHFDDPTDVVRLIETGIKKRRSTDKLSNEGDELGHMDDGEALRANLTVFFVQVLKVSPKYKKGSQFRVNLKAAIKACDTDNFF